MSETTLNSLHDLLVDHLRELHSLGENEMAAELDLSYQEELTADRC